MTKRRTISPLSKMPNLTCGACQGLGTIAMTAHFYTGDVEWDATCWECYGSDVRIQFPHPRTSDNG